VPYQVLDDRPSQANLIFFGKQNLNFFITHNPGPQLYFKKRRLKLFLIKMIVVDLYFMSSTLMPSINLGFISGGTMCRLLEEN
jgi:hypothetical protein